VSRTPAGGLGPPDSRCRRLGGFQKRSHQVAEGLAIEGFLFDQTPPPLVEQVTAGDAAGFHRLIQGCWRPTEHLRINLPARLTRHSWPVWIRSRRGTPRRASPSRAHWPRLEKPIAGDQSHLQDPGGHLEIAGKPPGDLAGAETPPVAAARPAHPPPPGAVRRRLGAADQAGSRMCLRRGVGCGQAADPSGTGQQGHPCLRASALGSRVVNQACPTFVVANSRFLALIF